VGGEPLLQRLAALAGFRAEPAVSARAPRSLSVRRDPERSPRALDGSAARLGGAFQGVRRVSAEVVLLAEADAIVA
jgi:hypothetical protein